MAEILAIESEGWHGGKVVHLVGGVLHVKVERGREGVDRVEKMRRASDELMRLHTAKCVEFRLKDGEKCKRGNAEFYA